MSWRGCVTRFDGSTHSGSVRGVRVDHTLLLLLGEDGTDLRTLTRRGGE